MRRKKKRNWKCRFLLALLLPVLLAAAVIQGLVSPMIVEYAVNEAQYTATNAINSVMLNEIYQNRSAYQGLVTLDRDDGSHVTALRTDVITMNNMKAVMVNEVYDTVNTLEDRVLEIPLGSVFAPGYFAGRGPCLRVGMAGLGFAKADFISAFSSAGINQTRHNILLEVTAEVRVLMPLLGHRDVTITSRYPVTDTVLVGTVPEHYPYGNDIIGAKRTSPLLLRGALVCSCYYFDAKGAL